MNKIVDSFFNLKLKRTGKQAIQFYIFYLIFGLAILGCFIVLFSNILYSSMSFDEGFQIGLRFGRIFNPIYTVLLTSLILFLKESYKPSSFVLLFMTLIFTLILGQIIGLIPTAILTTFDDNSIEKNNNG